MLDAKFPEWPWFMYIKGGTRCHSVILPSMLKSSASMPAPISALTVLVLTATLLTVQATPWQPTIRGCAAQITSNGDVFKLVGTDTFSQFIQCECVYSNSLGFHVDLSSVQPTKAICMITAMVAQPEHTVSMCASHAVFRVSLVIFF
jgi:hypothetical protein